MPQNYTVPEFRKSAFNCPHCSAYAKQEWEQLYAHGVGFFDIYACGCSHCKKYSYWYDQKQVVPAVSTAPMPHEDTPAECQKIYSEARDIADKSPRGAGALIRQCLEKLLLELGGKSENNINQNIGLLAAEGKITARVKKAADLCRLSGNELAHPSAINNEESRERVSRLFKLINYIVEDAITVPRELEADFNELPETLRKAIENRDEKAAARLTGKES